jgi:hypothetical protein
MIFASIYSILIPEFKMALFPHKHTYANYQKFYKLLPATVPTNLGLCHRLGLSGHLDTTVTEWEG